MMVNLSKKTKVFAVFQKLLQQRTYIALLGAALLYSVLCLVLFASFPNIYAIKCTVELEHDGKVQIYYKSGLRKNAFREKYLSTSKSVQKNKKTGVIISLPDSPVESIRIDPGYSSGVIKLYSIHLASHFSKRQEYGPKEIFDLFKPGTDKVSMQLADDHVKIIAETVDPYIISSKPLLNRPWFLIFLVPLPFALFSYLYFKEKDWSKFVLFIDLNEKRPASGLNINGLDGLRGLAAIMVVADHCWGRFTGLGAGGVWIFIALSGFLLAKPFAANPARIVSIGTMKHFYARRCQRILPIYYFYIIIIYLVTARFDAAIKHFLFLQGAGHLWVIPQEILFYLLIPFVFLINHLLFRGKSWIALLFTAGLAVAANQYLTTDVFSLYGMFNQHLRLFIGVFLSGVSCAYLFEYLRETNCLSGKHERFVAHCCSVIGLLLLLFLLLTSTARLWGGTLVYARIYFAWYGIAAALLVLCIVLSDRTFFSRLLSWQPLRSLGVVSLSFYLFHPLILGILNKGMVHFSGIAMPSPLLFVCTLIVSYLVARLTYFHIEKPFMK